MITRMQVNHWMRTLAVEDYAAMSGGDVVPPGLVSDPARYPACVSRLEAAAVQSPVKAPVPPGPRLLAKCRGLYEALKLQAMKFLVQVAFFTGVAHDLGITVSNKELLAFAKHRESYLHPDDLHLRTTHQITYSDELVTLRLDMLDERILAKINTGGSQAKAKFQELDKRWTALTNCQPGYVVEHCEQYTSQAPATSASVLMEQVAALATGRCINTPACSKQ
jgi:hypothetical protein